MLRAIAWPNLCECVPGTPSPTPFPVPAPPIPSGWPSAPVFTCTNLDVCATLVQLQQQVSALAGTVGDVLELVTLQQRYSLPMAYLRGATHSSLSGTGQFATSRLLGIEASSVFDPAAHVQKFGNPEYIFDLGWMAIGDSNGMLDETRLTRANQLWLPPKMPAASQFLYALDPGVTVSFTELEAEP